MKKKSKRNMVTGWSPDYPTSKEPPRCPTCKQRLPSDHAMVTVDEEKMHNSMHGENGKKSRSSKRGVGGRGYQSATEKAVREDM